MLVLAVESEARRGRGGRFGSRGGTRGGDSHCGSLGGSDGDSCRASSSSSCCCCCSGDQEWQTQTMGCATSWARCSTATTAGVCRRQCAFCKDRWSKTNKKRVSKGGNNTKERSYVEILPGARTHAGLTYLRGSAAFS